MAWLKRSRPEPKTVVQEVTSTDPDPLYKLKYEVFDDDELMLVMLLASNADKGRSGYHEIKTIYVPFGNGDTGQSFEERVTDAASDLMAYSRTREAALADAEKALKEVEA